LESDPPLKTFLAEDQSELLDTKRHEPLPIPYRFFDENFTTGINFNGDKKTHLMRWLHMREFIQLDCQDELLTIELHVAILLGLMVFYVGALLFLYLNIRKIADAESLCKATYITLVWDLLLTCRVLLEAVLTCVALNKSFDNHFIYLERLKRRVMSKVSSTDQSSSSQQQPEASSLQKQNVETRKAEMDADTKYIDNIREMLVAHDSPCELFGMPFGDNLLRTLVVSSVGSIGLPTLAVLNVFVNSFVKRFAHEVAQDHMG
jgi:hypothetical protein